MTLRSVFRKAEGCSLRGTLRYCQVPKWLAPWKRGARCKQIDAPGVCPNCGRGWYTHISNYPVRYVYRREDLANIQDFNLTWEWFGAPPTDNEHGLTGRPPNPVVLVTPKVMNLLRAKTKKEAKHQGCEFVPIWVEDSGA